MIMKECNIDSDKILRFGCPDQEILACDSEVKIISSILKRKSSPNLMQYYFLKFRNPDSIYNENDEKTYFHITSFGPFHGVTDNPSSHIVRRFEIMSNIEFADLGLSSLASVDSLAIIETSGVGVNDYLKVRKIPHSLEKHVYIHLGVHGKAIKFHLEKRAWNEADFRCPDERNWEPCHELIIKEANIKYLDTNFSINQICSDLEQKGHSCLVSEDPGRFICNYLYCSSLYDCTERTIRITLF